MAEVALGASTLRYRRIAIGAIAFIAGGVAALGFAPLHWYPIPLITLAAMAWLARQSRSIGGSTRIGFWYGLGLFVCGIWWIFVALHDYGEMIAPLAGLITIGFAAVLAMFPAIACGLTTWLAPNTWWLAFPATWTLMEWARGWVLTGFPWLALGYSQVPFGPLAGFAPLAGAYGVTFAAAVVASSAMALIDRIVYPPPGNTRVRSALTAWSIVPLAGTLFVGWAIKDIPWTRAEGEPFAVTLIQGNIPQNLKFQEDRLITTLSVYESYVKQSKSPLIVLPETALPMYLHDIPAAYIDRLATHARSNGGDLLTGVFENSPAGSATSYNSVISLGSANTQSYRKYHLVPLGEYIPLKPLLAPIINDWLNIPLSDLTRGDNHQSPITVVGQKIAVNICFEDVFGEEIIRQLPEATLLANFTNDAWYGNSWASEQHLQISQMRAMETGRMMLRATNTGITAVVNANGIVEGQLPEFVTADLTIKVQGRSGSTPYVVVGNVAAILWAVLLLGIATLRSSRQ